jgi:phosphatidate cytidylyltransferase
VTIKQRLITAAVALPILVLLLGYASPAVLTLFVALLVLLALLEFNRMGLKDCHRPAQRFSAVAGAAVIPLLYFGQAAWLHVFLALTFLLLALIFLFRPGELGSVHRDLGWICLGLLYLPLLLGHLIPLRLLDDGREWIFLTLVVIMCCDTCAYLVGSRIGKNKLYPLISPNKSIEGAVGGILGAVLGALLAKVLFFSALGVGFALLVGLVLGVAGQLGDLFESLLKRACGVKDSGTMIPGHGGILDRLDSLLFAFPLMYYLARFGFGG